MVRKCQRVGQARGVRVVPDLVGAEESSVAAVSRADAPPLPLPRQSHGSVSSFCSARERPSAAIRWSPRLHCPPPPPPVSLRRLLLLPLLLLMVVAGLLELAGPPRTAHGGPLLAIRWWRCLSWPDTGALPGVLLARAAPTTSAVVEDDDDDDDGGADAWGEVARARIVNYESGLKPFMTPWRDVRRALHAEGCFSTMALPRLTQPSDMPRPRLSDAAADSPTNLPPLCRKPLVLISGRGHDCGSCNHFARDVLWHYRAEWEYIRAHVTLVDAGDPMTEQLSRKPYPLWHDPEEVVQRLTLTKLTEPEPESCHAGNATDSVSCHNQSGPAPLRRQSDMEDFTLFNTGLQHKAALFLQSPTAQATHRWSRLVKGAFAGQSEYVLRIIFAYPHNGSVMRDVVNEEVSAGGSQADYLHFFTAALPFFHCVKKAVRVMEWLQRHGDY